MPYLVLIGNEVQATKQTFLEATKTLFDSDKIDFVTIEYSHSRFRIWFDDSFNLKNLQPNPLAKNITGIDIKGPALITSLAKRSNGMIVEETLNQSQIDFIKMILSDNKY